MSRALATAVVLGLVLSTAAIARAESREEALAALRDRADDAHRRRAVASLAESGTMADVPVLVAALRDSDDGVRSLAEAAIWEIWSRSGDEDVDRLLQLGIEQMQARDVQAAVDTFTRVIERRPEFAEGWNKRATVYYMMGEYRKSLADCDEVMKRNPYHFGALAGYGMIYLHLDQPARALEYFERGLAVNPNMTQVREAADALRKTLFEQRKNTL